MLMLGCLTGYGQHIITGPYEEDNTPYFVRVRVNYIDADSNNPWWGNYDLSIESGVVLRLLNDAFNQHNIFFLPAGGAPCDNIPPYSTFAKDDLPDEFDIITDREDIQSPEEITNALNIYVLSDSPGGYNGDANTAPSNFVWVKGKENETLVTRSQPFLVHEVGHALGLYHTHAGTDGLQGECNENAPGTNIAPGCTSSLSYCCGDYVEETPVFTYTSSTITSNALCQDPNNPMDDIFVRNYMSYVEPRYCQNEFVPQQVYRMKAHLREYHTMAEAGDPIIKNMQYPQTHFPGGTLSFTDSGPIIVESGTLTLTTPLTMLPNASIRVKSGGVLGIRSVITSACPSGLWEGIIVENGGQVFLRGQGLIEHAVCGVKVLGGGDTRVWGGSLLNNETGLLAISEAGTTDGPDGQVFYGNFIIDNNYRGSIAGPKLIELKNTVNFDIAYSDFMDNRPDCNAPEGCPSSRAVGIEAEDSGFASRSNYFYQLAIGIKGNDLFNYNGGARVYNCTFEDNILGAEFTHSTWVSVRENTFSLENTGSLFSLPGSAPVVGIKFIGGMPGMFQVSENEFIYLAGNENTPFVGTWCESTMEALANGINYNLYSGVQIGNYAAGNNGNSNNGLVYRCNNHNYVPPGVTGNFPEDIIDYFIEEGATIRIQQSGDGLTDEGDPLPTGIIFTTAQKSIVNENESEPIGFYFDENFFEQEPSPDSEGIERIGVSEVDPSEYCVAEECKDPPCDEPSEPIGALKEKFEDQQLRRDELKDSLLLVSGQEKERMEQAAKWARQAKDKTAGQILRQYALDTVGIQKDSIYRWLDAAATFGSRYLLARSQFFSGDIEGFTATWDTLPVQVDLLPGQAEEYKALSELFSLLVKHEASAIPLEALSDSTIMELLPFTQYCNEAGHLAANLLRRNGINTSVDCTGQANTNLQAASRPSREQAKEKKQAVELRIFPNPARELLTVVLPDHLTTGQLELFDMQGRQVLQRTLVSQRSEVRLPGVQGVYIVMVYTSDSNLLHRQLLVVQ
jgi:hypothetical protein